MKTSGFLELPHTADWAIRAWAADFPGLLESAALGMYALMGVHHQSYPRIERDLDLLGSDRESLLVLFLNELLFLLESDRLVVDSFHISEQNEQINAHLSGYPLTSQTKEIKAVTYHNLAIRSQSGRMEAEIVFDV